jgi:uncharacterized protein
MPAFSTYILKVAGRCNLSCDYCYMYRHVDQSWRKQPTAMSPVVWQTTARRIREHVELHPQSAINVVFHGGEPLLLGKATMCRLLTDVQSELDMLEATEVDYSIMSNGTLLDAEWIDIFYHFDVRVGISLDGDPAAHDAHRIDFLGRGTYARVRHAIDLLLASSRGQAIFGGTIGVINIDADPVQLLHHLLDLGVTALNFLPPDCNHDRLPIGKQHLDDTSYGDWLIALFDEYRRLDDPRLSIRDFDRLMRALDAADEDPESLDGPQLAAVVVETNGDINAMDILKVSTMTDLSLNILEHSLEETAPQPLIRLQLAGNESLCRTCRECPVVAICRGGEMPHRFSQQRGFDNPSVYCADQRKLIEHIRQQRSVPPGAYMKHDMAADLVA